MKAVGDKLQDLRKQQSRLEADKNAVSDELEEVPDVMDGFRKQEV
jgi:chaperonin cofactor prefoldin